MQHPSKSAMEGLSNPYSLLYRWENTLPVKVTRSVRAESRPGPFTCSGLLLPRWAALVVGPTSPGGRFLPLVGLRTHGLSSLGLPPLALPSQAALLGLVIPSDPKERKPQKMGRGT